MHENEHEPTLRRDSSLDKLFDLLKDFVGLFIYFGLPEDQALEARAPIFSNHFVRVIVLVPIVSKEFDYLALTTNLEVGITVALSNLAPPRPIPYRSTILLKPFPILSAKTLTVSCGMAPLINMG